MTYMRTDYGNAERLVAQHGRDLRYCHPFKRWYCWDGNRWRADDSGGPVRAAKLTVRSIYSEASDLEDGAERKSTSAWAKESESNSRIRAMLSLAASEADVVVLPDELDWDPWALNCTNGTLDLRTGKLGRHDRGDLITHLCPVAYDPAASAPTWHKFLQRVFDDDAELIEFLQRAVGYSLTGMTGEECLFVPYGTGANGKSKFLGALHTLLAGYAKQVPRDTLMAKRAGGIPNDLAALAGVRFATAIETGQRRHLDEEIVKQLTGGELVPARFLHGEFFEFKPVVKIWLATNHRPQITGTDDGIWRRIRLVPFNVTIPEDERDQRLAAKLEAELPGILAWAVEGCLAWQREGLKPPAAVTAATDAYRREEDVLGEFLDQRCVISGPAYAYAKELHDAYAEFTGDRRMTQKAFGALLRDRGFDTARMGHGGRRAWVGVGLTSDDASDGVG
jgi:putative DNA primase/helicase